ncbi:MAG TPA: TIGR02266 family protein [Polyangiaceae bacterium]|jgi:uncharacterized protein (TIGR02266 family)
MKRAKDFAGESSAPEAGGGVERPGEAPESVRREHERFAVELEVNFGSEHNFYAGLAQNLSAGGVFVATHRVQKVGSKIDLKLSLPDSDETYDLIGEVRWVRVYNEASDTPPGLGIRFFELPPRVEAAINKFLGQREPLFFDDD